VGQRPEERALLRNILGAPLVIWDGGSIPTIQTLFTVVGAGADTSAPAPPNIGWRLDYVLASPAIAERATSCVVQADVGTSDHAQVMMTA